MGGGKTNWITASVRFVDAFGNPAVKSAVSATTLTLARVGPGTLSPTSLSIPAGATTTTATFKLTMDKSNTASVTITSGGLTLIVNLQQ